ncbi:MAG: rhodanese-like domain-containing protein [Candidatus Atribacteria bacterium]|nr:rhodanese-like domain-containing protein [Candidatus Atribacteria bacterium]
MKKFDDLLKQMDLNYFGNVKHKISFEKMLELKKTDKVFILDVRTKQENEYMQLPFAHNIPTDEIPDRIHEIPKNKTIAVFCSSATRATIVYTYLLLQDYDVKIVLDSLGEIAGKFKLGYVLKNCDSIGK